MASVFGQTWQAFEVLVVDDGPVTERDRTQLALRSWGSDTRLRYLPHDAPLNASRARNHGLRFARGEWIAFLDDDDVYAPRKLEAQWQCAQQSNAPLVLCGSRYCLNGRVRIRQVDRMFFKGSQLLLEASAGTPFIFHRRHDDVRFDESLSANEDQDYFLRLVEAFALDQVPNVPEPLVDVYPQPQHSRVNTQAQALRAAQRVICLRHAGRFGREAGRRLIARSELLRCRWRTVSIATLWRASCRLYAVGGREECRLILNTWLLRFPLLRRFMVS